jgi:hypothetical protein
MPFTGTKTGINIKHYTFVATAPALYTMKVQRKLTQELSIHQKTLPPIFGG